MLVGACAGSTGGGLKVSRIILVFKAIRQEIILFIHPRSVKAVGLDDKTVDKNVVKSVVVYFALFIFILLASSLLVSVDGFEMTTNFASVLATINNVGPGFGVTGPAGSFATYSYFSKFVFIFDMLAGRLELYPILLLIVPIRLVVLGPNKVTSSGRTTTSTFSLISKSSTQSQVQLRKRTRLVSTIVAL